MNHQVRSVIPDSMALNHPFWQFSLSVYARPEVRDILLAAQAKRQIWVNDWLFALWAGAQGNTLNPGFTAAIAAQDAWRRDAILPWRVTRMALKGVSEPLYEAFKKAEVALERADQAWLYAQSHHLRQSGEQTPENAMRASLSQLNGGVEPAESEALVTAALSVTESPEASRRR